MATSGNQTNQTMLIQDELGAFKKNIDVFFLIVMGSIVFFLQAGFAFYESGSVRSKNVTSVLFRKYMDTSIGALFYFLCGYALAFGDGNGFCGSRYFALIGLPFEKMGHCFFQYTFAATAITIVSSPVHERCSMTAYFAYTILISGFTYPIVSHWAWSPCGWLFQLGFKDFAGSVVVHATGGASCLAAAIMAGPRLGRFEKNGEVNLIPPHSIPQATLGAFIFLFGVIAFNAGSNLTVSNANDGAIISRVVVNTLIIVSSATVTSLVYQRFFTASGRALKNWNFVNMLNGSFAGMVVSCAGCDQYVPWASLVVGILCYFAYLLVLKMMYRFQIDDATNAVPVQLGAGYFGVICSAIFGQDGVILSPSKSSAFVLLMNIIGGAAIIVWSFVTILLLYVILRHFDLHRATAREEKLGLDLAVHNQAAYNMDDKIERIDSVTSLSNRSTAKVQPSSPVPCALRRMVSEPHIHAW